jgi:hypothetical protein
MMPATHAAPEAVDSISAAVIPLFSGVPRTIGADGIPGFNFAICYGDLIVPDYAIDRIIFSVCPAGRTRGAVHDQHRTRA